MASGSSTEEKLREAHGLLRHGRVIEAEKLCRGILDSVPSHPDTLAILGAALLQQRKADAAAAAFQAAAATQPDSGELWNGLGVALDAAGRPEDAVTAFDRAIHLEPGQAKYRFNAGNAFQRLRRHGESAEAYRAAARLAPGNATFLAASLRERQQACLWDGLDADKARLFAMAGAGVPVAPFRLVALGAPPWLQRRNAESWAKRILPAVPPLSGPPDGALPEPQVIGYLSGDFREHPTPSLVADLFEAHDRGRFRVHAYSFGPDDGGAQRRRIAAGVDRFVDLAGLPAADSARVIRRDGVHVLVDLMGWTRDARPAILAHRAAPVQVGWLGYPGTFGSPVIDYLVADPVVLPRGEEPHYTEHVVRLPDVYQPNSRRPTGPAPERREAGLPDAGMIYCSFNLAWKFDPTRFALWMRLLRAVPGSVLWLLDGNRDATANLRREVAAAGVDPARLVMAPRLPPAEHLARVGLADLFLDTLPYNAHTTASDALWAGCPVLTRPGIGFAERVAASLLTAAGLDDMIAANDDAYLAIARRLGERPDERAALRARLADPQKLVLFDSDRFARHLEAAYVEMWRRGARPAGFDVLPGGGIAGPPPEPIRS